MYKLTKLFTYNKFVGHSQCVLWIFLSNAV